MNRLHIEGMPENKGNSFLLTEVRQPIPREDTLDTDNQVFPIGGNDAQKRFRRRRQILMNETCSSPIEDTDVHRLRM